MRIRHINTIDNAGGAAQSMLRLKDEMQKSGVDSKLLVSKKSSNFLDVQELRGYVDFGKLNKYIDKYKLRDLFFIRETDLFEREEYKEADVIHLHNIHGGYFKLENLERISKEKPLVWTFHDMWPICGNTPHTFEDDWWSPDKNGKVHSKNLFDKIVFDRKSRVYKKTDFKIVVPSEWLYSKVKKSVLKNFDLTLINNGVDQDNIYPLDKVQLRKKYGIDNDKKVISFISHGGLKNKWKGGIYMEEVISRLSFEYAIIFLEIGTKDKEVLKKGNHWKIPFIEDREELNEYLNLSDIFLFTSIAENFPLVLLEAQSAGIPTVTFDVGGSKEIVKHLKTGYVSRYKDVEDTIKGVKSIFEDESLARRYSINARKNVIDNFTLEKQAKEYIKLYERAIDDYNKCHNTNV